MTKAK